MRIKTVLAALALLLAASPAGPQTRGTRASADDTSDIEVTRAATLRITIASDPLSIFDYLVDAKKLESWFPDQAVTEPQLGGRYHFHWDDREGVWNGRFTYFIRGNSLNYTWQAPDEEYETSVEIKLSPQGSGTLVELTHSGFTSNAAMDKMVKDWAFYLQNLKSVIEDGTDLRPTRRRPARRRKSGRRK